MPHLPERGKTVGSVVRGDASLRTVLCDTAHPCSHSLTQTTMWATLTMPRELACFLVTKASPQSFLLTVAPTLGYLFHCSISKYPFFPETSAAIYLKRLNNHSSSHLQGT